MASKGEDEVENSGIDDLISALPRDDRWQPLFLHGGFWHLKEWLRGRLIAQQRMAARDDDILLASMPKAGMTWLKSLVFAVVRRDTHRPADPVHPLRRANPHDCVMYIEEIFRQNGEADLEALPSPRILSTHSPYSTLPPSARDSGCRVVYVCRNPKDHLVSFWHFRTSIGIRRHGEVLPISMETAFELFCEGRWSCGPYWDNVLEFWNESRTRPEKVLFLLYEDMMEDTAGNVRKLARFLGRPFSEEEERDGTVGEIVELCSFRSLSGMEVNKGGNVMTLKMIDYPRNSFFRKGEVGDWVNHLTPEMGERLDRIIQEKLQGSGLLI